jgi:hypothetical protein
MTPRRDVVVKGMIRGAARRDDHIVGAPGTFIAPGVVMNFFVGGPLFVIFFLALVIAISLAAEADRALIPGRPSPVMTAPGRASVGGWLY